jgi:imidazolonepropionase-like amidohydrolase
MIGAGLALDLANAEEFRHRILLQGAEVGSETVSVDRAGTWRAEYSYNDRGRGEHIVATWKLDSAGVPTEYEAHGNDYMKAPVDETFAIKNGVAAWQSRSEHGQQPTPGEAFYLPVNAPPEFTAVLSRALVKAANHRIAVLPAGEAVLVDAGKITAGPNGPEFNQYQFSGLSFTPETVWLGHNGETAALLSDWLSTVAPAAEPAMSQLQSAQRRADTEWAERIARESSRVAQHDLVVRNIRLFDPRDLSVTPGTTVWMHKERIVRVGRDEDVKAPSDAEVIDGRNGFLMPGLWDNHQHFGRVDGALDLANGVTNARDMANNTDSFLERVARFDAGTELGPTVLKAGIIDGTGQFAAPTKMRVDTAQQAIEDVDWYADHGYVQIKIYSSVKPELVPIIADRAHSRGLRVSGHVPAFMSARQFVEAGADEIQHLNFIELNFLFPEVQETRNRDRFIKVAEHAREFTPDKPEVREFIDFLKKHHTVLDPTMNVFEALFCGDPTRVVPALEPVAGRFPPQVRRQTLSGALDIPKGQEDAYREAFPAMLRLLKALYDAGVTILPGTDQLAGYTLHHELELYAAAGIPAAEVLRMATLTSATVMAANKDRGVIAAGKIADMVLLDGDPVRDIRDIRNVKGVILRGRIVNPRSVEKALGIAPRQRSENRYPPLPNSQ